jgi:hypothetical protein
MAYTGDIADRPDTLDGCWQTWTESQTDNVIKSAMDAGVVKTRRRFTGIQRKAQVSVTLAADLYQDFQDWFNVYSRQGSIPTRVKTPYGAEEIWMFVAPPVIEWIDANMFKASTELYAQAGWND